MIKLKVNFVSYSFAGFKEWFEEFYKDYGVLILALVKISV